jgi:hypothetical protein
MKKLLIILLFLFIITTVNAQKNFQGEITYRLHASVGEKEDAELKILFGQNKLKLRFKEKEEYEKEELFVLIDSAAMFTVNNETKTYSKKMLHLYMPSTKQYSKRSFAGYSSTPLVPESNGMGSVLGGLIGKSSVVFYLADSFYYNIPNALVGNQELIAIQNNKIVLGADIYLTDPFIETQDSSTNKANIITVEAIEIRPMTVSDGEFSIPADYVDKKSISYEPVEDSMVVKIPEVDSVAVAPPPVKIVPKKPVKSNKPKTKAKPAGLKRKE